MNKNRKIKYKWTEGFLAFAIFLIPMLVLVRVCATNEKLSPNSFLLNRENISYNNISLTISIILTIGTIISGVLWLLVCKKRNNVNTDSLKIKDEEENFAYLLENFSAAEIAYINKGPEIPFQGKAVSTTILSLANKGLLKIDNISKENKKNKYGESLNIKLTNLYLEENENKCEMLEIEKILYKKIFKKNNVFILMENEILNHVAVKIHNKLQKKINKSILDQKVRKMQIVNLIWLYMGMILWMISTMYIADLKLEYTYIYYISIIPLIIHLVITTFFQKLTPYGEEIISRIENAKKYIEELTEEEISKKIETNSNYYFNILPYTHALDMSKTWSEKFKNHQIIRNDMGNLNYYDINDINKINDWFYLNRDI